MPMLKYNTVCTGDIDDDGCGISDQESGETCTICGGLVLGGEALRFVTLLTAHTEDDFEAIAKAKEDDKIYYFGDDDDDSDQYLPEWVNYRHFDDTNGYFDIKRIK